MELRSVTPDALDLSLGRFRLLPEGAVKEKIESMQSKGQMSPLVAASQEGRLVLVDGFLRQMAAVKLGLDKVLVEVVQLSAVQMKAQVYLRNRERGLALLEECRLVQELVDLDGLSQVEVGDLLERHKSWVCRRLGLFRELSPHLVQDWSAGLVEEGVLRRLAQLPPRNQETVWAVLRREGLTGQDAALYVELWQKAPSPDSRRYLEEQPVKALELARGQTSPPQDARLGPAGQEVYRTLTALRQTSLRLARRLQDGMGEMPAEGRTVLRRVWEQARQDCGLALDGMGAFLGGEA
jgi:ParB-like chromosome segregation protein Spo0J